MGMLISCWQCGYSPLALDARSCIRCGSPAFRGIAFVSSPGVADRQPTGHGYFRETRSYESRTSFFEWTKSRYDAVVSCAKCGATVEPFKPEGEDDWLFKCPREGRVGLVMPHDVKKITCFGCRKLFRDGDVVYDDPEGWLWHETCLTRYPSQWRQIVCEGCGVPFKSGDAPEGGPGGKTMHVECARTAWARLPYRERYPPEDPYRYHLSRPQEQAPHPEGPLGRLLRWLWS